MTLVVNNATINRKEELKMLWNFIDKHKDKDNVLIKLISLLYSVGKNGFICEIVSSIILLFIPNLFFNGETKKAIALIIVFVLVVAFKYLCIGYKNHQSYVSRQLYRVLQLQSEAASSMSVHVEGSIDWQKNIFENTCQIVCSKIRELFLTELKIKTRISVETVVDNKTKNQKEIKMFGRQSANRQNTIRTKALKDKEKYFIYKIFDTNNVGENILKKQEIENALYWYKNPKHNVKVYEYWGIAVPDLEDNVLFVLEIDIIDNIKITEKERKEFINNYLKTFIQLIKLAYLLENEYIVKEV